jgi:hypothetical protein
MSTSRREKRSSFSPCTKKNSTAFKSPKLLNQPVTDDRKWGLGRYIPFSIVWKPKNLSNPAGVMRNGQNVEVQEGATTSSQNEESQPLTRFSPSDRNSWHGNLDEFWQSATLEEREAFSKWYDQASKLEKWRTRKFPTTECQNLWAFKWIARPTIYLFPSDRWEEQFGDLQEIINTMVSQYPRPYINMIIVLRTLVLASSAIQIQLQNLAINIWKKQ